MPEGLPSFTDTGEAARAIARALEPLRPLAEERRIRIAAPEPDGEGSFDLDPTRLERVVAGLVGDAIHAAAPGTLIEVTACWKPAGFELQVRDEREHEGADIGMSIAHRIVESFGGSVMRSTGPGARGFAVTVLLPQLACPPDTAPAGGEGATGAALSLDGLRVLYIDDEADIAEAVGLTLESMGATVRTCTTFEDATELLGSETYDVVVTDLSLGGGSTGFDVIELMRTLPGQRLVPAMVLSAYDAEDDRGATRDAGFVAHIVKPIDFTRLAREMQSAVRRARSQGRR